MADNQTVNGAATTLANSGQDEAAKQLAQSASSAPGVTTTIGSFVAGNPRAAQTVLGRIAPELDSRELGSMMNMASLMSLFKMLPMFGNMLSGMTNNVMGGLMGSQGIVAMGNNPDNPLAKNLMSSLGMGDSSASIRSMDPATGVVGAFGAPAINTPAAVPYQQNNLAAVPGMSGPSLSPGGRG